MSLNSTSYVILGLLSVQPNLSGYDMRKAVQETIGYFWGESFGQIYPALQKLEREGLIARSVGGSGRKGRQEYVLTETGRERLRAWLATPFHNEPPRNEFLLKLFFAGEAAPGVALTHVRDLQERNRHMLETLRKIEESVPEEQKRNPHLPYWMLALGMGKALTLAALAWGEEALVKLAAEERCALAGKRTAKKRASAAAPARKPPRGRR